MTEVRTFTASSMQEALEVVRRELGPEAVILHTRQASRRRILPWLKRKQEVEITAGVGVSVREPAARVRVAPETRGDDVPNPPSATAVGDCPDADVRSELEDVISFVPQRRTDPATRASNLLPDPSEDVPELSTHQLAARLDSIQSLVERLNRASQFGQRDEVPSELFHLYTDLIDSDVEDELARELVFRLRRHATADQLTNADVCKSLLTGMVESEITCASPITPRTGVRRVVALVGPTGVGKTTTIAKLAANFRLRDGVKMGLVTVDTYRIAAVEQLRTYAEIIDLPMKVVTSPLEMRRALDELAGLDLILVDTAGRSPRDDLKIQELKSLLVEADVDEVHLVLSTAASARSLVATAEKFAPANVTALILTKIDEAAEMGTLLSAVRKIPLPISYLTTGQDVPDDIEPANAGRLARLILGQERVFE